MTTAFTIDGNNWHYNEKMSELVLAISERSSALDGTEWSWDGDGTWTNAANEYTAVTTGADCQHPYFLWDGTPATTDDGIQGWIINNCRFFVPDSASYPADDQDGESNIWTIADYAVDDGYATDVDDVQGCWEWFCTQLADLSRSASDWGFRRSTNGTSFINNAGDDGHHRPGDYITGAASLGYWIWDDIIEALSHLRITLLRRSSNYSQGIEPKASNSIFREGIAATSNPGDSGGPLDQYDGDSGTSGSGYPEAETLGDELFNWICRSTSIKVDYYVPPDGDTLINAAKLYYKSGTNGTGFATFGLGLSNGVYSEVSSALTVSTTGVVTSDRLLEVDSADFVWSQGTAYNAPKIGFDAYGGTEDLRGIVTWNFTNGTAW